MMLSDFLFLFQIKGILTNKTAIEAWIVEKVVNVFCLVFIVYMITKKSLYPTLYTLRRNPGSCLTCSCPKEAFAAYVDTHD